MIDVQRLRKTFGDLIAVEDLSFSVQRGEILGFLGPNGAGKSTTMKMLTGFWEPTAGTATINGADIRNQPLLAKQSVGYLPESAPFYGEMTAQEYLEFTAEVRGFRGVRRRIQAEAARENCFLQEVWHQPIETLSKGYRQRVGLAQALLHNPPVLILDEPTDGLDPNQKTQIRQLILSIAAEKTIVLSTHILEEVEALCTRITILSRGKLKLDMTPDELRKRSKHYGEVTVRVKDATADAVRSQVLNLPQAETCTEFRPNSFRITPKPGQKIAEALLQIAKERRWTIEEFHVSAGRFEDVFREMTHD